MGFRKSLMIMVLAVLAVVWGQAQAADISKGRQIYGKLCQNCHGSNGAGQLPGAPDFSRGERLLQPDSALVESVTDGKGMMPAFRGQLKDKDLLNVIAYIRTLRR